MLAGLRSGGAVRGIGDGMKRSIVIFVAAVAATLFVVACGPQRIEVGELQTESRSVEA
jgi:hypothetical protein